ncbi:MAG: hypothetical protein V1736_11245 [Pseudomonadota bacterium]
MVCIRSEGEACPSSKYLTDFVSLSPKELYTESGIETIREFLKGFRASGVICINELMACWLNEHRPALPMDVSCWFPPSNTIQNVLSKEKQIEAAKKAGFNVLPTYKFDKRSENAGEIPSKHFPLCYNAPKSFIWKSIALLTVHQGVENRT